MYADKRIAVVVPAYNEERLIGQTLTTMPDYVDHIIVVDDCSQDGTVACVCQHIEREPERILLLQHESNQGVGGSIATGYKWCRDQKVDVAVVMAGDAQMDPADLLAILAPVVQDKADYSKGNRLFTGDAWNIIPRVRYLGNSVLSLLTKIASGYWHIADSQSGYTAISLRALQRIDWDKMYKRYGQPNDLLVRLNILNFRVCDVPVRPVYNVGEKSGINPIRMIPRLSLLLFKLFLFRMKEKYIIRDFHPLIFFYFMGVLLFPGGLFFGLYLFFYRLFIDIVSPTSALFATFLFISGLQSIFFAMWFDMEHNRDLKGIHERHSYPGMKNYEIKG
jgi:glycosyltransferase involved in cell wall biosynthesis